MKRDNNSRKYKFIFSMVRSFFSLEQRNRQMVVFVLQLSLFSTHTMPTEYKKTIKLLMYVPRNQPYRIQTTPL